ncbi:MAG: alanine--tRNA ligase [Eubacteriales bacterium]|nr:alanine--tRNA ligase [Eubacteriales bacterium]
MQWTGLNELREKFLTFFESKGHLRHKSYPLVPINDKSVLLINAGMTPLKKYFTGEIDPPRKRMATCQKCIRTPDIERVGITARHGTFFEMLGNFSFGDYFKHEAIIWAWEFVTEWLGMPPDRLWVTIYTDDDEAYDIWADKVGVDADRIIRMGKPDNFWEHGAGPCGPCSEIYYDRGDRYGCGLPDCKPGCDCDRFMEFWNLVFTQFNSDGQGNYTRLDNPNIDTGMGLERLACLMQGADSLFEVDTIKNITEAISLTAGVKYGDDPKSDISLRVITDHIRSTAFLICDGVVPSNEGRGYVLRRLLRRAARHGRLIGIKKMFLPEIIDVVARESADEYPELTEKLGYIKKIVSIEEERFAATVDSGLDILSQMMADVKKQGNDMLPGADIFKLNDTYGFPIDLTREIAAENGLKLDEESYTALMREQKSRARAARIAMGDLGWSEDALAFIDKTHKTEFTGYHDTESEATVTAVIDSDTKEAVGTALSDSKVYIILDKTPFYAESGGQVGDTGYIKSDKAVVRVTDTKKHEGMTIHFGTIESGVLSTGDTVIAAADRERRNAIRRNHSSAHLLQSALRKVLGGHVEQAGSYVDDHRVRFDFTHFAAMTGDEIARVEAIVNDEALSGTDITTTETDIETAKSMGAIALFGEKYDEKVRVVKMGDYSCELCGGTHLDNTAELGLFKIISESSVASGIRRIEATTGYGVLDMLRERDALITDTARELKANNPSDISRRAAAIQNEIRLAKNEIDSLNAKLASFHIDEMMRSAVTTGRVRVIVKKTENVPFDTARVMCDQIKGNYPDTTAVISVLNEGALKFIVGSGKEAVRAGAHAGNIARQVAAITNGNGGGRPDSATSGGKDIDKVDEALATVPDIVASMLKN